MTVLTFDPERHEYHLGARLLPNVTSITDKLASSYGNVPDDVLERARDRGTAVHLVTQLDDEGDLDEASVPDEVAPYLCAWRQLREDTGFVPTAIEERVHSLRYGYAGTLDRAGHFHRLRTCRPRYLCLLDIKATAQMLPMVGPQTAAYGAAWDEHHERSQHIQRRFCAWLRSDGTYRLEELTDPSDLSVYLAAMTLEAWRQRHNVTA